MSEFDSTSIKHILDTIELFLVNHNLFRPFELISLYEFSSYGVELCLKLCTPMIVCISEIVTITQEIFHQTPVLQHLFCMVRYNILKLRFIQRHLKSTPPVYVCFLFFKHRYASRIAVLTYAMILNAFPSTPPKLNFSL